MPAGMNAPAVGLTLIAAGCLAVGIILFGRRKQGYSHLRHTISELGERGAPDEWRVGFGLFLPIGLLLLAVAWLVHRASPASAALAMCIAVGYVAAAFFPCDPGSPLSGSFRQALHNVGGAVEYIGGGFALMTIAGTLGQPFKAAGFVVLAAAIALSVMSSGAIRGGIQRVAECCLFGALALAIWRIPVA